MAAIVTMYLRTFLLIFIIQSVKCDTKTSLVFVIDNTGSMYDDIEETIKASKEILKIAVEDKMSKIENFVLVTFNDPFVETVSVTDDASEFSYALRGLEVYGGADCPEMSMTGIERALQVSLPGSFIYVFTDASAKDHIEKAEAVKVLSQTKKSKIIFLLTGMCDEDPKGSPGYQVYHEVAAISSGQVFHLTKKEVARVLKSVSLLITGNSSVLTSKHLRAGCRPVIFTVDSKTTDISISVSGENVRVSETRSGSEVLEEVTIVTTSDVLIKKLHAPKAGDYNVTVCSDIGSSVMISATTDLDFLYGFSNRIPKSLAETYIQPTIGKKCYLAIELLNPEMDIEVNSLEILDLEENVLSELPCKKEHPNYYVTDQIEPPNQVFKIAVKGYDKIMKTPIKRISKTAIEPIKPLIDDSSTKTEFTVIEETTTEIKIDPTTTELIVTEETTTTGTTTTTAAPIIEEAPKIDKNSTFDRLNPGTKVIVECPLLQGEPKPKITWYYKVRGTSDYKEIKHVGDSFPLEVNAAHQGTVYRCNADNDKGHDYKEIVIRVNQKPVFLRRARVQVAAAVGDKVEFPCKVRGIPTPTIKWIRNEEEIENPVVFKNNSLILIATANDTGKYQCVATNDAGTTKSVINEIRYYAAPVIEKSVSKVYVDSNGRIPLSCDLLKGYPLPIISWYYRDEKIDILSPPRNPGMYKCIARNKSGEDIYYLEVIFKRSPVIVKHPPQIQNVLNNNKVELLCIADGAPEPNVTWNRNGLPLTETKYRVDEKDVLRFVFDSSDADSSFTCTAENIKGRDQKTVKFNVLAGPRILSKPNKPYYYNYDTEKVTMTCEVTGNPKPKIIWAKNKVEYIRNNDRYTIDNETLEIRRPEHDANYTCEASNKFGRTQRTFQLVYSK